MNRPLAIAQGRLDICLARSEPMPRRYATAPKTLDGVRE